MIVQLDGSLLIVIFDNFVHLSKISPKLHPNDLFKGKVRSVAPLWGTRLSAHAGDIEREQKKPCTRQD